MTVRLENVGIAVRDIEEAIAFFTDLGRLRRADIGRCVASRRIGTSTG